jgi:ADP-ribose pyrophosphatase YjhB (NUDIX family)
MYKIYFGERYVLITDKGINNSLNVFPFESIKDINLLIKEFDENITQKTIIITYKNPKTVFTEITKYFTFIEAAGGLVINSHDELLLIYRYHKWDLPKGKREKNESIEQCALREVEEECGISGHTIIKQLPSSFHTYHDKNKLCIKQTFWFEMKYDGTAICTPQLEEDISQAIWVKKNDLFGFYVNTYPSVIEIVELVL